MKKILSRLACLIRSIFGSERNYGCLPDDSRDAQPTEEVGAPESSFPKSANPVEKGGSLL
jgi:hypothetical protein